MRTNATGTRAGVILAGLLLLLTACSDDGDDGSDAASGDAATTSAPSTTTSTQPSAGDGEEAVRPHIEDLLGQWDTVMTGVLAEVAEVEADPAHPLRLDLAELFTETSPYLADFGQLLTGYTSQDVVTIIEDRRETVFTDFTEVSGDRPDFVSFVFCSSSDTTATLSDGSETFTEAAVTQGAGEAHRTGGTWLLHSLQQLGPVTAASDPVNPCPAPDAEDAGENRE